MWRRVWWLVLVALIGAAACAADGTSTVEDGDVNGAVAVDVPSPDNLATGDPPPTAAGNDAAPSEDPEDSDSDSSEPPSEPRFDPLPIPATADQVQDVFVSMLGPTDDYVAQMRRVDPDYRPMPTPPGAEITEVYLSYAQEQGGVDPSLARLSSYRVTITSTGSVDELADALQQTVLAENPDWSIDERSSSLVVDGRLLKFDLPDIEQWGGEQNLTPDLRITVEGIEGSELSQVRISFFETGPDISPPDEYSGWQDELPLPEGTTQRTGSIWLEGEAGTLKLTAAHTIDIAGLAEYRDQYLALLAGRGLTVESEAPYREGTELTVTGHPRFDSMWIRACCTENRYITEITNVTIRGIVNL